MSYPQKFGISLLIFIITFISGALGFFHVDQNPTSNNVTSPASSTKPSAASEQIPSQTETASATRPWRWVPISEAGDSGYSQEDQAIYYDGTLIPSADPSTFLVAYDPNNITLSYAKDKDQVYFGANGLTDAAITPGAYPLPNADPSTFEPVYDEAGHFAFLGKDKSHVYADDTIWLNGTVTIDPASFMALPFPNQRRSYREGFYKDDQHVYTWSGVLQGANASTFTTIGSVPVPAAFGNGPVYAKDASHVFVSDGYRPAFVVPADPSTFVIAPYSPTANYDASDDKHFFLDGEIVDHPVD